MLIKRFNQLKEFTAGDNTKLREYLNPLKEKLRLRYSLAHASVEPGETTYKHLLENSEVYYIISGEGRMNINDETETVFPGDVIYIPPGSIQSITNSGSGPLKFLCIVDPAWEPEIERVLE